MKSISKMLWNVSQKTNSANTGQETHAFMDYEKRFGEFQDEAKMFDKRPQNPPILIQSQTFQHEYYEFITDPARPLDISTGQSLHKVNAGKGGASGRK